MDLRSHLLSAMLLLTASEIPPGKPDLHPKFLHGVWECNAGGGDFIRLILDADGAYVHWRIPDRGSPFAGHGYAGEWSFGNDVLVLMRNSKHLTPGDGHDREVAIQELEAAGQHSLAEQLARTDRGWIAVSDEESHVEGLRIQGWDGRSLHLNQWLDSKGADDLVSVDLNVVCHRQALRVKPAPPSGA